MICNGIDAISGEHIEVEFDRFVSNVNADFSSGEASTFLAPGFIDLQVNGFAGVDFNSTTTTTADIARASQAIFSTGVTRFFATVITNAPDKLITLLKNLARARETLAHTTAIEGFHIEGPHISPEDGPRGAHPREWVRRPDPDEFLRWQEASNGLVKMVTLAPEWPGACDYIEQLTGAGVVVAIGHTQASAAQIHDAVSAGATVSTHLGNGAGSKNRRDEFISQQLQENRLSASFIVDGHHLPVEFLREALNRKGTDRSILVTDAVAPALCAPGLYELGQVAVELRPDGRVTLRGNDRLAGSILTMDRAVSLVMQHAGVSLREAIVMATSNAARAGRIANRLRGFNPGERGDIVEFKIVGGQLEIASTFLGGEQVYARAS